MSRVPCWRGEEEERSETLASTALRSQADLLLDKVYGDHPSIQVSFCWMSIVDDGGKMQERLMIYLPLMMPLKERLENASLRVGSHNSRNHKSQVECRGLLFQMVIP
jgi:hypothetical protein